MQTLHSIYWSYGVLLWNYSGSRAGNLATTLFIESAHGRGDGDLGSVRQGFDSGAGGSGRADATTAVSRIDAATVHVAGVSRLGVWGERTAVILAGGVDVLRSVRHNGSLRERRQT